ncbi:protein translocase subunit [Balamuthia mandrillaris]
MDGLTAAVDNMTDEQRAAAFYKLKEQVMGQTFAHMVDVASDRCFEACVPKPSGQLQKAEQQCLLKCTDRFYEARQIVYRTQLAVETLEEDWAAMLDFIRLYKRSSVGAKFIRHMAAAGKRRERLSSGANVVYKKC